MLVLPWVMPAAQHWHSLPATVLRGYHIPRLWIGTCLFNTNIPCGKQREKLHKPESTSCFMPDFHGYSSCLIELMRLIYSTNSRRPDGTIWSTISKSGQCSLSTLLIGWIRCFSNRKQAVTVRGMNWHAGSPLGNAGGATLAFAAGDRLERISYPEALDRDLPVQHQHSLWQATGKSFTSQRVHHVSCRISWLFIVFDRANETHIQH